MLEQAIAATELLEGDLDVGIVNARFVRGQAKKSRLFFRPRSDTWSIGSALSSNCFHDSPRSRSPAHGSNEIRDVGLSEFDGEIAIV